MSFIKRIRHTLETKPSLPFLKRALIMSVIFFILYLTDDFWIYWLNKLWIILRPFVLAFGIAYIFHPIVEFFKRKGLPKKISIPILFFLLIGSVIAFFVSVIPMLYGWTVEFVETIIHNFTWLQSYISASSDQQLLAFIDVFMQETMKVLQTYYKDLLLLNLSSNIQFVVNIFMDIMTVSVFTIIISIYMLFDFDRLKGSMRTVSRLLHEQAPLYLHAIDDEVHTYLQSLLVLMALKFVEYSLLYFLLGHPDFWVMGALMAVSLVVPFLGATISNLIGIATMLSFGFGKVALLIICILILSNIDAYIISPLIHSRRSFINPLWILLAIFIGANISGFIGVVVAIPMLLVIKICIQLFIETERGEGVRLQSKET